MEHEPAVATTVETEDMKTTCKCGRPRRPGGRNCKVCHGACERDRRGRLKRTFEQAMRVISNLTVRNTATQAAFYAVCRTNAVLIAGASGEPEVSGFVIGFLPDMKLKVLDDDGRSHIVDLSAVQEDLGRTIYGRHNQTEFHTPNIEGDQGSSSGYLLAAFPKASSG